MKKLNAVLLIVIIVLGGTVFVQRRVIQRVEAQNESLLSHNARISASENGKPRHVPAEEEDQQQERERSELLRLRAEVNALRRAANVASNNLSARSAAPGSNAQTSGAPSEPPIKVFETRAEAVLQPGETFMTGGWQTSPGKRTLVLASPEIIDAAGNIDRSGNQIVVRTHFVEMPDAVLQSLNAHPSRSDGIVEATFSENGARELIEQLRTMAGVDILSAPAVTTLNGRRAQVAVQDVRTPDGQENWIGSSIGLVPVIAQNGGVSLSVAPKIALPNPNWRP
jgi:hypothetical protein